MKIVFKSSNYVVNVKNNSKLAKDIKTANGDEIEISKMILDSVDKKCKKVEHVRNIFINFIAWGILLSAVKASGHYESNLLDSFDPFIYGFTSVCSAIGLGSIVVSKSFDKKYYKILNVYNKALTQKGEKSDNNDKEDEISNKKML